MEHTTIAVDLAKSVFQIAVSHRPGHVDEERRLSRDRFLEFFAQRPPAAIVLEACGSAHYWARQLQPFGHQVRLLAPHDVRPYVRRNKTDRTDAKGLLEAYRNEEIHAVPVKSVTHQAIASHHGLRSPWLATRTSRLNTIRGLLPEFGIFIPVGAHHVVPRVRQLLADPATVPLLLHPALAGACDEIGELEAQMQAVERQFAVLASDLPDVTLLQTVPGVGLITATALVARVTDMTLSLRATIRELPRVDAQRSVERLAAPTQGDQQARRRLSAYADARRAVVPLAREDSETPDGAAALGRANRAAPETQCRGRRRREQAGADGVGRVGCTSIRSRPIIAPRNRTDCNDLSRRTAPSARIMAHRSDRRGATPITRVAKQGRGSDGHPARGFHDDPEP